MASFHHDQDSGPSKAKSRSVCDASAAQLLLQVRRIALDEVIGENLRASANGDGLPLTPLSTPPRPIFRPRSSILDGTMKKNSTRTESRFFRTISIGSPKESSLQPKPSPFVTPLQGPKTCFQLDGEVCSDEEVTNQGCPSLPSFLVSPTPKTLLKDEENDPNNPDTFSESPIPSPPFNKKFVADTLPEGVVYKDTLHKKFSWKAFPELEAYLVENRKQYLEYSNALNYTKAQKIYNNKLTQGLLELAGQEGYIFDSFTFAQVRDRIRCFYKSFVQATKKKKRGNKQRGRSVTF